MIGFVLGVATGVAVVSFFPTLGATIEGWLLASAEKVVSLVKAHV